MRVKSSGCPLGHTCEEPKTLADGEQVLYRCNWYVKLRGKDPQSNQEIDEWKCAIAWAPILHVENAQMSRQTGKAVESFRNQMARDNHDMLKLTVQGKNHDPDNS